MPSTSTFLRAGARRATRRRPRSIRWPADYAARGLRVVGVDVLESARKAAVFRSEHRPELSRRHRHGSVAQPVRDQRAAGPRLHRPWRESCVRSWLVSSRPRRCAPTSKPFSVRRSSRAHQKAGPGRPRARCVYRRCARGGMCRRRRPGQRDDAPGQRRTRRAGVGNTVVRIYVPAGTQMNSIAKVANVPSPPAGGGMPGVGPNVTTATDGSGCDAAARRRFAGARHQRQRPHDHQSDGVGRSELERMHSVTGRLDVSARALASAREPIPARSAAPRSPLRSARPPTTCSTSPWAARPLPSSSFRLRR